MKPRRLHRLTIFSMRCASSARSCYRHRLHDSRIKRIVEAFVKRLASGRRLNTERAIGKSVLLLRFDRDFGLHRVSNETLLVRAVIHLLDFRASVVSRRRISSLVKCTRVIASLPSAFFSIWPTASSVFVEHELLFARDRKKSQHVTTRERGDKRFLRIDKLRVSEIRRRSRRLHFVSAIKFPGVIAWIFLILERRVAALPSESNFMFGHAFR